MLILSFVAFSKYRPLYIIVVNSVWEDVSSQSDCTAAAFSEVRSTNYYVNPRMFFFKHTRSHISGRHELDSSHLLLPPPPPTVLVTTFTVTMVKTFVVHRTGPVGIRLVQQGRRTTLPLTTPGREIHLLRMAATSCTRPLT